VGGRRGGGKAELFDCKVLLNNLGVLLVHKAASLSVAREEERQKRKAVLEEAVLVMRRALVQLPDWPEAWHNLEYALDALGAAQG